MLCKYDIVQGINRVHGTSSSTAVMWFERLAPGCHCNMLHLPSGCTDYTIEQKELPPAQEFISVNILNIAGA